MWACHEHPTATMHAMCLKSVVVVIHKITSLLLLRQHFQGTHSSHMSDTSFPETVQVQLAEETPGTTNIPEVPRISKGPLWPTQFISDEIWLFQMWTTLETNNVTRFPFLWRSVHPKREVKNSCARGWFPPPSLLSLLWGLLGVKCLPRCVPEKKLQPF